MPRAKKVTGRPHPLDRAEANYRNRFRLKASPRDGQIMLRAHLRLKCANDGHAWMGAVCVRCGYVKDMQLFVESLTAKGPDLDQAITPVDPSDALRKLAIEQLQTGQKEDQG